MAEAKELENSNPLTSLKSVDRVKNLPVIQSAIQNTGNTYSYVKDSHHLINWALSQAESGLHYATATVSPLTTPLTKCFEQQITAVDQKLCEGLDIVEGKVPMMMQPPQQIYNAAKEVMSVSLQPTIDKLHAAKESATQQASTLKEISITKANELLSTRYGNMAMQSVDSTGVLVNHLLDQFFPAVEGEQSPPAPVSADENKVLHAVQTIGQLSSKTATRVYHSVCAQLKTVKKEDVSVYISSVISILHLTRFLNISDGQIDKTSSNSSVEEKN